MPSRGKGGEGVGSTKGLLYHLRQVEGSGKVVAAESRGVQDAFVCVLSTSGERIPDREFQFDR